MFRSVKLAALAYQNSFFFGLLSIKVVQLLQILFLVLFTVHKRTQFSINVFLERKRRSRR